MVSVENQKPTDPDKPQDVLAGFKSWPVINPNQIKIYFKAISVATKIKNKEERDIAITGAANLLESGAAKFKSVLAPDVFDAFSKKVSQEIHEVMNSADDNEVKTKFQEIFLRLYSMQREIIKNDYESISAPNPKRVIRAAREIVLRDLNYDSAKLKEKLNIDEQQSKEVVDFLRETGLSSELLKNLADLNSKIKPKTETPPEKTVIIQPEKT